MMTGSPYPLFPVLRGMAWRHRMGQVSSLDKEETLCIHYIPEWICLILARIVPAICHVIIYAITTY